MPADIKARPSGNDDARAKKMQELFSRIEAGVSGVFTSDNYRSYLRTMLNSIGTAPGIAC